jgi:hypothetical protein
MEDMAPIKLILMQNTITKYKKPNKIVKVYDLKGSIIHREITKDEN